VSIEFLVNHYRRIILKERRRMKLRTKTDTNMSNYYVTRWGFLTVLICAITLASACNGNDTTENDHVPVISSAPKTALPMPPLNRKSFENLGWDLADGKHAALSEFKGKVLVLDFYATWCQPCRESIPHLINLQRRYENDLRVVGLNVGGPGDLERVSDFAREFKIQYPLGLPDQELVTTLLAESDAIPQTFVFDRNGELLRRFVGFDETTGEEIDHTVEIAVHSGAAD
jgi:thiol-disulfide isomerase/thioredoxin